MVDIVHFFIFAPWKNHTILAFNPLIMFKKLHLFLASLLLLGATTASANGELVDGIYYLFDGTNATVTYPGSSVPTSGNNSYAGAIVIPATVTYNSTTYNVTAIGDNAFKYAPITSISLPEGLLSIGEKSIYATNITTITVPNSVTTTAYESFGYNTLLEEVHLGENIAANTWGDKLFYNPSGTGKKKTVYMYCSSVPTLQSYTFGFAKATVRVYPSMVNDFKAVGAWTEYSEIVGDLAPRNYTELQDYITYYESVTPSASEIGNAIGCYTSSSVADLTSAINAATALGNTATVIELHSAAAAMYTAYNNLQLNPLLPGYYYIQSGYYDYNALYGDAATASTIGLKYNNFTSVGMDTEASIQYYFKLTPNGENWNIQCADNGMYVGTGVDPAEANQYITLTDAPTYPQVITAVSAGKYHIQSIYSGTSTTYPYGYYNYKIWTRSDDTHKRTFWVFNPIPVEVPDVNVVNGIAEIAQSGITALAARIAILQAKFNGATKVDFSASTFADDVTASTLQVDGITEVIVPFTSEITGANITHVEPKCWVVAATPSAPVAGKSYVLKNAYNGRFLITGTGTTDAISRTVTDAIWTLREGATASTFVLKSESENGYWQYVNYGEQTWDATTPYDGFDWYGYAGMNAAFGAKATAQEFLIQTPVVGDNTSNSVRGSVVDGSYVLAAVEPIMSNWFKLGCQSGDAALEPWQEDVAWLLYEATPSNDLADLISIAADDYFFDTSAATYVGTNPGLLSPSNFAAYDAALAALQAIDPTTATEAEVTSAINTLKSAYSTAQEPNPIVEGYYYIVCDNAKIAANGKPEKALYANKDLMQLYWGELETADLKYVFRFTDNGDGTWNLQNMDNDLYAGAATEFCGKTSVTTNPDYPATFYFDGEGSYRIKANDWTYCPQGNPDGDKDGPSYVWAYNGGGIHAECSYTLRAIDAATMNSIIGSMITDMDEITTSDDPGRYTATSVATYNTALSTAKEAVTAGTADITTYEALLAAKNQLVTNPITEGYYFIASAGNGPGYSGGPYEYEDDDAMFNADGIVKWKAYDSTDASQLYYLTQKEGNSWYVYNVMDATYIDNGGTGNSSTVYTSTDKVNGQEFHPMALGSGKFAIKSPSYCYGLAANHNGSPNAEGNLCIWGTVNDCRAFGVNVWYLHKVSNADAEQMIADAVANTNSVVAMPTNETGGHTNVVFNGQCSDLVLTDGQPFSAPSDFTATTATYTRTMTNEWGTICLPYDVSSNATTKYYTINAIENNALVVSEVATLTAGTPGLVQKVSGDAITATATNVPVSASIAAPSGTVKMYGVYERTKVEDPNAYYIKDNKFWQCNNYFFCGAFRAYFTTSGAGSNSFIIVTDNDDPTAIASAEASNNEPVAIYSTDGTRLGTLRSGINIVKQANGKTRKVFVK